MHSLTWRGDGASAPLAPPGSDPGEIAYAVNIRFEEGRNLSFTSIPFCSVTDGKGI